MKYGQKLPAKVEKQLDDYIKRIKKIQWFRVDEKLEMPVVEKQIKLLLKAFGIEAKIEYRDLKTPEDFNAAWDAARDAARDDAWAAAWAAAWYAARDAAWAAAWAAARAAARDAAWYAARDAARAAAWCAARDAAKAAACAAADLLALNLKDYKKKYPCGNFINLIPLWEMGLYPCGVVDGVFIVYIPRKI
jgi:hypothetical protein